jgi:NAD(P)-dependent dehydrogenase (short-subunit alcohol dehydrogenase family)
LAAFLEDREKLKRVMGDGGEDGQVNAVKFNIEDWGLKHSSKKERIALLGHILMNVGANHATEQSSNSYDQIIKPLTRGIYLGYGSAPTREDVFYSIEHWKPGNFACLKSLRRKLGAEALVSGVASASDANIFLERQARIEHGATSLLESSVNENCLPESYPHGSSCSRHAALPLSGKKALVVGGTGAIGEEVVQQLSELGAAVVVAARNGERCKELAERVWVASGLATCEEVDLNRNASVRRLGTKVFQEYLRPPDVLVLSAAASKPSSLWPNHLSSVLLAKQAFEKNPRTVIVAVSSGLAHVATPSQVDNFLQGGLSEDPFKEHAASKRAQAAALLHLRRQGAKVMLVEPPVTVKSTLVEAQMPFVPAGMQKQIQYGTAVEASRPIVDAVLRSSRAATPAADQPCRGGCAEIDCVGSAEEHAKTWSVSLGLLEQ